MAGIEAVLEEVGDQLMVLDISQLGECCVQLSVTIPPAKMGKKLVEEDVRIDQVRLVRQGSWGQADTP